jgi:ribosomal protein L11 methyltransferase
LSEKEIIYLEYHFSVAPVQPATDILLAELAEFPFDSFAEVEDGLKAYILKEDLPDNFNPEGLFIFQNSEFKVSFVVKEVAQQNWNQIWESSFEPIEVEGKCVVRAPFHPKKKCKYDIVIEPKMSFGTGHHATTFMMLQHILTENMVEKKVLDMGCGTGVLAILAAMRGAQEVDAIDIDHWCYLNAFENKERNQQSLVKVFEGGAEVIPNKKYDVILANINKNILLADIETYVQKLSSSGSLIMSGFYSEDVIDISAKCGVYNLKPVKNYEKDNWVAVKYVF